MMHAKADAIRDHPAYGTLHGLSEGGDGRASASNRRPHQRGPRRLHADIEAGDKYKPHPPTTPQQPPSQGVQVQQPLQLPALSPPPATTKQASTQAKQWGADLRSLLCLCKSITAAQLPDIWGTVPSPKKYRAIVLMEAASHRTADILRFPSPPLLHAVAVMVVALAFHTEDPDKMGGCSTFYFFLVTPPWRSRKWPSSRGNGTQSWGAGP